MAKREISLTPEAQEAILILGQQIRRGRHRKGWSAASLASRVGVSPRTITSIEAGSAGTSIGTVLNAAVVVGFPLFGADRYELIALRRRGEEVLALLPGRVFENDEDDDDVVPDF
ncbi:MAG: helix-turn-helix transcriptional regulator [Planctomycetales bacterium]|nr:helix-turn-helix transcriptional regulator [Planctomycetales bacterium]